MDGIKRHLMDKGNSRAQADEIANDILEEAEDIVMNGSHTDLTDMLLEHDIDADSEMDVLMAMM